jgi:WD40 repeat protein
MTSNFCNLLRPTRWGLRRPLQGGQRIVSRSALLYLLLPLLAACQLMDPGQPPVLIIDDAHSGGSIVRFNKAATVVASGGWEGRVCLWGLADDDARGCWEAHRESVNGIAFLHDDDSLVTGGYDGILAIWGPDGTLQHHIQTPSPITAMAATGERLVTGHDDGSVRLWNAGSFQLIAKHHLHAGRIKAVAIDYTHRFTASAGNDGEVYLYPATAGPMKLPSPPTDAWTLAFSPDGKQLMGGGWFRLFRWSIPDGRFETLPTRHHGIIKAIQFGGNGRYLASISRQTDSSVYFLDPETGETVRRFQRHDLCGGDIHVSDDGRYLATTSDDASVRIWRLDN